MNGLHGLDTLWRGWRFRSRLEARWAVFFTALGVDFEYEPQGFALPAYGPYLPDFRLTGGPVWVEVKPASFDRSLTADPAAAPAARALHLLAQQSGATTLLVAGPPWPGEHAILWQRPDQVGVTGDPATGPWWYDAFADCRRCDGVAVLKDSDDQFAWCEIGVHTCGDTNERPPLPFGESARITAAYSRARAARFEHGDTP